MVTLFFVSFSFFFTVVVGFLNVVCGAMIALSFLQYKREGLLMQTTTSSSAASSSATTSASSSAPTSSSHGGLIFSTDNNEGIVMYDNPSEVAAVTKLQAAAGGGKSYLGGGGIEDGSQSTTSSIELTTEGVSSKISSHKRMTTQAIGPPPGWAIAVDEESGEQYMYHEETNETKWMEEED